MIEALDFTFESDTDLRMNWTLSSNLTSDDLNITVTYYLNGIGVCDYTVEGNVTTVDVNATEESLLIVDLVLWRRYRFKLDVKGSFNMTDHVFQDIHTPDKGKTSIKL